MIIDSSAVLAILFSEPEAREFAEKIEKATVRKISAANWLEVAIVGDARGDTALSRGIDLFFKRAAIEIEPVTVEQVEIARQAFLLFGKGRHPAALNFGDCFAYALSKAEGEPLLFKGQDFVKTDVRCA